MLVGIEDHGGPHLVGLELLDAQDVVFVVVIDIEVGQVVFARRQHHEYAVVVVELTKELSVLVVVQAFHVGVEPNLSSAQCAMAVALQRNLLDGKFGEQVAFRRAALDAYLAEVFLVNEFFALAGWVEGNFDDFCLAIGIDREIDHAAVFGALGQVVLTVADDRCDVEALDIICTLPSVAIHHIIYSALVVLFEHTHMEDVLANENLVGHAYHLERAILVYQDDVVDV